MSPETCPKGILPHLRLFPTKTAAGLLRKEVIRR
jgi:hypothetical protein